MSRAHVAAQRRNNPALTLIACLAVLAAGLTAYALTQDHTTPAAPAATDLTLLQQQPTLGNTGTRYDIVIDLECPHCNQFLSSDAYNSILEQAHAGQAQLNVTAAAFLNERSHIKGNVYNCIAQHAGPAAALQLLPQLKTRGGDTNHWITHARELGVKIMSEARLQFCLEDGSAQQHANAAFHATGARGVPAVFINGTQTPWTQVQPN